MNLNQIKTAVCSELHKQGGKQAELCRKTGLDRKTMYNFFHTDKSILLYTLLQICDALGLELVVRKKEE